MRKFLVMKSIFIIIVFLLLAGGALYFFKFKQNPLEVRVEKVKKGKITEIVSSVSSGTIKPLKRTKVISELPGKIEKIFVEEDDFVNKGDPLIKIEDKEIKARIKVLEAQLQLSKIRINEAKTKKGFSEKELNRVKELYKKESVAEKIFDGAHFQYLISEDETKLTKALYQQAISTIELAKISLEKTLITAPQSGKVLNINVEEGETSIGFGLSSGMQQQNLSSSIGIQTEEMQSLLSGRGTSSASNFLMEIVDDSKLFAEAEFDEVDILKVKIGQSAKIVIDALMGEEIYGYVEEISSEVSKTMAEARTFIVKVSIPQNFREKLKIGMSADIEIITKEKDDVIFVPTVTVLERGGKKVIFTVKENKIDERDVKSGITNWDITEILEGVKEGELVIIPSDVKKLKKDVSIKIINE